MKTNLLIVGAAACALLVGCEEPAPTTQAPTAAPTASVAAATTASEAPKEEAIADADLAVPADFEAEAEAAITPASYKADLDAIDKELSAAE